MGYNSFNGEAIDTIKDIFTENQHVMPDSDGNYSVSLMRELQDSLKDLGLYNGGNTGDLGPQTATALVRFMNHNPEMVSSVSHDMINDMRNEFPHLQKPLDAAIGGAIHLNMNTREGFYIKDVYDNVELKELMTIGGYYDGPITAEDTPEMREAYDKVPDFKTLKNTWDRTMEPLPEQRFGIYAEFEENKALAEPLENDELPILEVEYLDTPAP